MAGVKHRSPNPRVWAFENTVDPLIFITHTSADVQKDLYSDLGVVRCFSHGGACTCSIYAFSPLPPGTGHFENYLPPKSPSIISVTRYDIYEHLSSLNCFVSLEPLRLFVSTVIRCPVFPWVCDDQPRSCFFIIYCIVASCSLSMHTLF